MRTVPTRPPPRSPALRTAAILGIAATVQFVVVSCPGPAHATIKPSARDPKASGSEGEYQRTIDAAVASYARRDFPGAYQLFLQAHALKPSARTQRGMGMAAFEMKEFVVAATHLFAALSAPVNPLPEDLRGQVDQLFKQTKVAVLRLFVEPGGSAVTIDGQAKGIQDGEGGSWDVFVTPGRHILEVAAPQHQAQKSEVVVTAGEIRTLNVHLEPQPKAEPVVDTTPTVIEKPKPPETLHLWLRSKPANLTFWYRDRDIASAREYTKLCQAPCELTLPKRAYALALSESDSSKDAVTAWPIETSVDASATVRGDLELRKTRAFFYTGVGMSALGLLLLTGGLLADDTGTRIGLLTPGGMIGLTGVAFLLIGDWPSAQDYKANFRVQTEAMP